MFIFTPSDVIGFIIFAFFILLILIVKLEPSVIRICRWFKHKFTGKFYIRITEPAEPTKFVWVHHAEMLAYNPELAIKVIYPEETK